MEISDFLITGKRGKMPHFLKKYSDFSVKTPVSTVPPSPSFHKTDR